MAVDSIDGLKEALQSAQENQTNKNDADFKGMYKWAYNFTLDKEKGEKKLTDETAIALWKMVYGNRQPAIFERWVTFLEASPIEKEKKGIPRDVWIMFANFADVIGTDLSLYNPEEAWPVLIDDFVEYEKDRLNGNVPATALTKIQE